MGLTRIEWTGEFGLVRRNPSVDADAYASQILGRPINAFANETFRAQVAGRRILVTGAGGHIGAGMVRRLAALAPAHLSLIENSEFNLYSIDAELVGKWPEVSHRAIYCDIRDAAALGNCFAEERPEIVIHAAALKHVPLMEDNPREAVLTNVIGARNVADAALASGARAVTSISTDKAVAPGSVLGRTKRLAEAWYQALDARSSATRFVSVRFGNVFGSTGSVVPLFARQIADGGPVTLTGCDMKRYFLTLGESTGLVLSALRLALAGSDPRGAIYLLEMGGPVPIEAVARRMIAASVNPTVPIRTIGARAGEKCTEALVDVDEAMEPTAIPTIFRITSAIRPLEELRGQIGALEDACHAGAGSMVDALLEASFASPIPSSIDLEEFGVTAAP